MVTRQASAFSFRPGASYEGQSVIWVEGRTGPLWGLLRCDVTPPRMDVHQEGGLEELTAQGCLWDGPRRKLAVRTRLGLGSVASRSVRKTCDNAWNEKPQG